MNKKILLRSVLILSISFTTLNYVYAGKASTGWWIFRRPQSTKPKAITTVMAVRGDLSGVFYNPAILGTLQQREIFAITELGLANDTFGGLLYGQPLFNNAGISAGVVYYDAGKTTLYWMEQGKLKERTVTVQSDLLGIVSYGRYITDRLLAGATFKVGSSTIAEYKSAKAFACDLGLIHPTIIEGVSVSLAVQNIGSSTKFSNRAEDLPMSVWIGCGYVKTLGSSRVSIGIDLPYIIKESRVLPSIGIEYNVNQFAVSLAYRFGAEDALLQAGFGLTIENFDFGYAFIPATYLSHTHRLSIGYRF